MESSLWIRLARVFIFIVVGISVHLGVLGVSGVLGVLLIFVLVFVLVAASHLIEWFFEMVRYPRDRKCDCRMW